MGDRLEILRVVSTFFPRHCPILLQDIELIEKYILFKHTCSRPYRLKILVLVRSPQLNYPGRS